jgi:hypothetical protein
MALENSPSKIQDLLSSLQKLQQMASEHPNLLNAECLQKSIDQANRMLTESTTQKYSPATNRKVTTTKKPDTPFL